jgi:hypothetical protein
MLSAILKRAVFYQGFKVKARVVKLNPKKKELNMYTYPRNARVKYALYSNKQPTAS